MWHFSLQLYFHDPSDIPIMQKYGIAISPGVHSMASIKQVKVYTFRLYFLERSSLVIGSVKGKYE